jgi:hypothetical protein
VNFVRISSAIYGRGSGNFPFTQVHFSKVATVSISDARKQCRCKMPTTVLSETRGPIASVMPVAGLQQGVLGRCQTGVVKTSIRS